jgi:hypothetical protein
MDLSFAPETRLGRTLPLLFIHHSAGGVPSASPDAETAMARCLWEP